MKVKQILWRCPLLLFLLASCSGDDDGNDQVPAPATPYYTLSEGNYWIYQVSGEENGVDSLYVDQLLQQQGMSQALMKARDGALGFYTNIVDGNILTESNGKVTLGSNSGLAVPLPYTLDIPLQQVVLMDRNQKVGAQLYQLQGEEVIPVETAELTIKYRIEVLYSAFLQSLDVGQSKYTNVIETTMFIEAEGVLSGNADGLPLSFVVLQPQNILEAKLYFAPEIGLIRSRANLSYQLDNIELLSQLLGTGLEATYEASNEQQLIRYQVN